MSVARFAASPYAMEEFIPLGVDFAKLASSNYGLQTREDILAMNASNPAPAYNALAKLYGYEAEANKIPQRYEAHPLNSALGTLRSGASSVAKLTGGFNFGGAPDAGDAMDGGGSLPYATEYDLAIGLPDYPLY
jgi:hypothetical protein